MKSESAYFIGIDLGRTRNFTAMAVLERTCVYETPEMERKLVSKAKILVERDAVPIRRRKLGGPPGAEKGRGKPGPKPAAAKAAAEAAEEAGPLG